MGWLSFTIVATVCIVIYLVLVEKLSMSLQRKIESAGGDSNVLSIPLKVDVTIIYEDREGTITERRISAVSYDGYKYLNAFCHLRNGPRTFKIDQIKSCTDATTGEVIEDVQAYFNELYARQKGKAQPRSHGE